MNAIYNFMVFVDFVDVKGCSEILKDTELNMIRNLIRWERKITRSVIPEVSQHLRFVVLPSYVKL